MDISRRRLLRKGPLPAMSRASEVAAVLDVHESTVYEWARRGVIPCLRRGRGWVRFDLAAVTAALYSGAWPQSTHGDAATAASGGIATSPSSGSDSASPLRRKVGDGR